MRPAHTLPVVDDRAAIPPDAEHFTDCMHLADKGAEAMAERFFRYIRDTRMIEGILDQRASRLPALQAQ